MNRIITDEVQITETPVMPLSAYPKALADYHMPCSHCQHFRQDAKYFWCSFDKKEFPALCEAYSCLPPA